MNCKYFTYRQWPENLINYLLFDYKNLKLKLINCFFSSAYLQNQWKDYFCQSI